MLLPVHSRSTGFGDFAPAMPVFPLLVEMFVMAKEEEDVAEDVAEDAYGAWDGSRAMPWWAYVAFLLTTFAFSMVSLTLPHSDIAPHTTWADWAAVAAMLMHVVHFTAQLRKQRADDTTKCCSKELIRGGRRNKLGFF